MRVVSFLTRTFFIYLAFSSLTYVSAQDNNTENLKGRTLEEIVVTATLREQNARDVPAGLQIFNGAALDEHGVERYEDYLLSIPTVSFRNSGNGGKRIGIRGVSNVAGSDFGSGSSVSTVGIYLNGIPIQGTSLLPDLALYDLQRIEVLKGPQGTLYGEGAAGGAIKMVLNSPEVNATDWTLDALVSSTEDGGINYTSRAMTNLPLSDNTAVRLVGSYKEDGGFIDNVGTGEKDYDTETAYSIRGILASQLTDKLSVELLALHDESDVDGFHQFEPSLGGLRVDNVTPQFSETETSIYGLTLKYDLGFAELTSVTSYYEFNQNKQLFLGRSWDGTLDLLALPPSDVHFNFDTELDTFSEEIRLVSSGNNKVDWILGLFYRDREQLGNGPMFLPYDDFIAFNEILASRGDELFPSPVMYDQSWVETFEQNAVYAEINFELSDKLELTTGLRWFEEELVSNIVGELFGGLSIYNGPPSRTLGDDSGVLPKIALSYSLTDRNNLYAVASKGFRAPVPNYSYSEEGSFSRGDPIVESDSTWNYEVGAKNLFADGRVQLDVSAFFVDWKNIQGLQTGANRLGELGQFLGSSGDGEIIGAELILNAALSNAITIGGSLGYMDSELTKTTSSAREGSMLPNIPEVTANAYGEYSFAIPSLGTGFLRFDVSYVDEQLVQFEMEGTPNLSLDSYTIGNLRLGVNLDNRWRLAIFVDNLWDERAYLGRGFNYADSGVETGRFATNQPRTVGLNLGFNL